MTFQSTDLMQRFGEIQEVLEDLEIHVLVNVFQQVEERLQIPQELQRTLVLSLGDFVGDLLPRGSKVVEIGELQRGEGGHGREEGGRGEGGHLLREEEAHEEISAELTSFVKQNSSLHSLLPSSRTSRPTYCRASEEPLGRGRDSEAPGD